MQINGQGGLETSPLRWTARLRRSFLSNGSPSPCVRFKTKENKPGEPVRQVAISANHAIRIKLKRAENSGFGAPYLKDQFTVLFIVLLIHAAAFYLLTQITDLKMPMVSVPLQISFAISEPVQEKPKVKPTAKPMPADEPLSKEKPSEESPSQVIPPKFDVAHLNNPVPDYPPLSRRLREQGEVILRVYVTAEGVAGQVQIHISSGYPRLDRAAQETVERWKFVPARQGDASVGSWVLVPIQYILKS
jgi:TonB family protein